VLPDLIIHLAAQASVGQARNSEGETWSINVAGTIALARSAAQFAPACTFFFVSTADLYGGAYNRGIVDEKTLPEPRSPYARSKLAAEMALGDILTDEARLIIARPTNHSGTGQDERFVIPGFAAQIVAVERGEASTVNVGNLTPQRDFLDVRDVVNAYMALLAKAPALPMRSTFNIASGEVIAIQTVLDQLCQLSDADLVVTQDPQRMRASDVDKTMIDITEITRATGWAPTHPISEMLNNVLTDQRRSR